MFQFPTNGKVLCKLEQQLTKFRESVDCFNSLRTGKCFASNDPVIQEIATEGMAYNKFQFPTNGKVLCKETLNPVTPEENLEFQFPTNGKVLCKLCSPLLLPPKRKGSRFNSLRTGKCFASFNWIVLIPAIFSGFNSLRTGKCFARVLTDEDLRKALYVSIPYERESALQVVTLR